MRVKEKPYTDENKRRLAALHKKYDPVTGEGSPIARVRVGYTVRGKHFVEYYTHEMFEEEKWLWLLQDQKSVENTIRMMGIEPTEEAIAFFIDNLVRTRLRYDFEYWAFMTAKIQDKESKELIRFILNQPQRKLLLDYETQRYLGNPIRTIIVKARQWGGSTLTQLYKAWIQDQWKKNWHSAIVADVEDQVKNIRHMYTRFADEYPKQLGSVTLKSYEQSTKNKIIEERGCIIGIGSMQKPDNLRSFDFSMLHLSEVGLWKETQGKKPEDLAQSLRGSVSEVPMSMIVMESTAKGVGNFFHREWQAAVEGKSGYSPVFVAWWEVERYQRKIENIHKFINWMVRDEYAMFLWELGATMEGINWYFTFKKRENLDDWRMQSEFPSTATEAFQSTGQRVFPQRYVQKAREDCEKPLAVGDLTSKAQKGEGAFEDIEFFKDPNGLLKIWNFPDKDVKIDHRYALFVDIGGTSDNADWSEICVFDRYWMMTGGVPEVVASWSGHLDQDLVAWKAVQLGAWYNYGLVAVEVNSLDKDEDTEGLHFLTVLDEIVEFYENLYTRTDPQKVKEGMPVQYGFHTNTATKTMIIDTLKAALRERGYIEKELEACDQMDTFENKPNGKQGAVDGCHDDKVIVRAGGVWLCLSHMPMPYEVKRSEKSLHKKVTGEASF